MSASQPSSSSQHLPQQPRTPSQDGRRTLAIRVVPYTPPLLESAAAGPSSSLASRAPEEHHPRQQQQHHHHQSGGHQHPSHQHHQNASRPVAIPSRQDQGYRSGASSRTGWASSAGESSFLGAQGSALSSSSSSQTSLAEHDGDSVSGTHRRSDPTLRGSRTIKSPVLSPQLYAGSPSQSSINLLQPEQDEGAGSWQRPLSRRRNVVALNADGKTFTLIPHQDRVGTSGVVGGGGADGRRGSAGGGDGFKSPPLSSTTNSSHERLSFEALSEDRPSSPLTTVRDHSHSVSPSSTSSARLADDHMSTSPWNYRMVGGLRKVPKTPDLKQKRALYSRSSENFLDPLPESPHVAASSSQNDRRSHPDHLHHHHHYLATRTSFSSSPSAVSENTNYKVYGGSSSPPQGDVDSRPASSTNSNYEIHGEPTPSPTTPTFANLAVPSSSPGAENYIVHGDPSPSPSSSSSLVTVSRQLRTRQSNESLVVPPLIPPLSRGKISTIEKFGYYRSRSRESLRAASLTSISSILGEQAVQSLFASPANPLLQSIPSSTRPPKQEQHQHQQDPATWASSSPPGSSPTRPPSSPMNAHPWSSQLSTVMSESEEGGGSDLGSRSLSVSSAGGRHHSRRTLSISSSIAAQDEHSRAFSFTHSIAESLERPQPAYTRGGAGNHYMQHHQHMYQRAEASASSSTPRLIRDQDEHGDGLADLRDAGSPALQHKHSRTKLGGFLSAASLSDRNLHSSAGSSVVSRANSFNAASLPAWARLYYSVGVPLTAPSELTLSEAPDSRPQTSNPEQHHGYGGRHRNYYIPGSRGGAGPSVAGPPNHPLIGFDPSRRLGKKSSSIWSPHLRTDKRASRFSMWEAPPGTWSIDSQPVGPRSAQVGLFIVGFVFPFAWMIGALLPLPPPVSLSSDDWAGAGGIKEARLSKLAEVDLRHENARWWRSLNRYMSVLGLLIIAAVVALVVVGVKQGWGQGPVR